MSDDHATFTQQVRALVAENDRVPEQRTGSDGVVVHAATDGRVAVSLHGRVLWFDEDELRAIAEQAARLVGGE